MVRLGVSKIPLLSIIFLIFPLQASLVLPITFKPLTHYKQLEGQAFGSRIKNFLDNSFVLLQAHIDKYNLIKSSARLQEIRQMMERFSIKNSDTLFDCVFDIDVALCAVNGEAGEYSQRLRVAIEAKSMEQLLAQAYKACIETLIMLEKQREYWDAQYAHQNYYFFHRSPLKWFSKSSRKDEISTHKKCIEDAQVMHQKIVGQIALLMADFNENETIENQYTWIKRCCVQLSSFCVKHVKQELIKQGGFRRIIKGLDESLSGYNQYILKKLHYDLMPSHFERNWALYAGIIVAAVSGCIYYKKNSTMLSSTCHTIKDRIKKNYKKYLNEPMQDIAEALGLRASDEKLLDAKKLCQQITSGLYKIVDNIGEQKSFEKKSSSTLEEITSVYIRTVQDFRDFHNQNFAKTVVWNPTNEQIGYAAATLDKGFLRQMYDVYSQDADAAGYLQIKLIINKAIPLLNIGGQVATYRAGNAVKGLIEIVDPVTQFIQFFIKQSELVVTQNRLSMAGMALLPAVGIVWATYRGIRSFGGYVLPKGYDDTPIRTYITKMENLLDDARYVDGLELFNSLDVASIGSLFYYSNRLEHEIGHLAQKNRVILQQLLEKFYLSESLEGKKLYLQKMLHEYHSWPRFIQR